MNDFEQRVLQTFYRLKTLVVLNLNHKCMRIYILISVIHNYIMLSHLFLFFFLGFFLYFYPFNLVDTAFNIIFPFC